MSPAAIGATIAALALAFAGTRAKQLKPVLFGAAGIVLGNAVLLQVRRAQQAPE